MLIGGGIVLLILVGLFVTIGDLYLKRSKFIYLTPAEYVIKMNALDTARSAAIESATSPEEIDLITEKYDGEVAKYKEGGKA